MKIIKVPEKEISDFTPEDFGGIRKEKTVCIIRYGAFGDILQTSSVLPLLKKQGYRICINTNEVGKDILVSNPYVDEIIVQRTNQIYPDKLDDYWKHFDNLFDKVIQFSESVEGTLLIDMVTGQLDDTPKERPEILDYQLPVLGAGAVAGTAAVAPLTIEAARKGS